MVDEEEEKEKNRLFFSLCGKLQLDQDIDEFLNDIREARYFRPNRETEI